MSSLHDVGHARQHHGLRSPSTPGTVLGPARGADHEGVARERHALAEGVAHAGVGLLKIRPPAAACWILKKGRSDSTWYTGSCGAVPWGCRTSTHSIDSRLSRELAPTLG